MHIHVGLMAGAATFATVLFFGTLWRLLAFKFKDSIWGQAMAVMY